MGWISVWWIFDCDMFRVTVCGDLWQSQLSPHQIGRNKYILTLAFHLQLNQPIAVYQYSLNVLPKSSLLDASTTSPKNMTSDNLLGCGSQISRSCLSPSKYLLYDLAAVPWVTGSTFRNCSRRGDSIVEMSYGNEIQLSFQHQSWPPNPGEHYTARIGLTYERQMRMKS